VDECKPLMCGLRAMVDPIAVCATAEELIVTAAALQVDIPDLAASTSAAGAYTRPLLSST